MSETTLPNGTTLHWSELGSADGVPVLWIHPGSVEDSTSVTRDLEPWFDHLRVITPDTRGHGRSQRFDAPDDYRWDAKCADLLLLLDHLGLDRVVWGGASMGAALSLWAAAHHGERVRAVVSVSAPTAATTDADRAWWDAHRHLVEEGDFEAMYDANVVRRMGEAVLARVKARPERYRAAIEPLRRHSVASFLALLDETYDRKDFTDACRSIEVPVLLVGGERDDYPTPSMSAATAGVIERSQLHIVEGAGHFPHRSHRATVNELIGAFLTPMVLT